MLEKVPQGACRVCSLCVYWTGRGIQPSSVLYEVPTKQSGISVGMCSVARNRYMENRLQQRLTFFLHSSETDWENPGLAWWLYDVSFFQSLSPWHIALTLKSGFGASVVVSALCVVKERAGRKQQSAC